MADKKPGSGSKANQAARYKANRTWEKNRIRKLERTLKAQPNNQQVKDALKAGPVYRRKTPKVKEWSHSWRYIAQIYKAFNGRFDRDIMSSNRDTALNALSKPGSKSTFQIPLPIPDKNFFRLEFRNNLNRKS